MKNLTSPSSNKTAASRHESTTRCRRARRVHYQWLESRRVLATAYWDGGGADDNWTTAANWEGDVAPSVGADLFFTPGAARRASVNDFAPNTVFGGIYLSGSNYSLSGNTIDLAGGIESTATGNSLNFGIRQTSTHRISQLVEGTLTIRGSIDLNGFDLTASAKGVLQFDGSIKGAGGLVTSGEIVLNSVNSYSGLTTVSSGTLRVGNGSALGSAASGTLILGGASLQLENDITVADEPLSGQLLTLISQGNNAWNGLINVPGWLYLRSLGRLQINGRIETIHLVTLENPIVEGSVILNGSVISSQYLGLSDNTLVELNGSLTVGEMSVSGDLSGTGVINGIVNNHRGRIDPGTGEGPGILGTNDIRFGENSSLTVQINGTTPGAQYDQLRVSGSVNLDVPELNIELGDTPVLAGSSYTILDNDGTDSIQGIFNGLGERSVIHMGSRVFRISYRGGDGNDIVLSVVTGDRLPPTDISLNHIAVAENASDGHVVGTLSTIDPDTNDAFTYSLVDVPNGTKFLVDYNDSDGPHWTGVIDTATDNLTITNWTPNPGKFTELTGPTVWPAVNLVLKDTLFGWTYHEIQTLDIPDDWSGDMYQDPIVFWYGGLGGDGSRNFYGGWGAGYWWDQGVGDFGTGPVGLLWYTFEGIGSGSVAVSQPDVLTITRVEPDPPAFRIEGNELVVNSTLDYESKSSHTIRIRSTDAGGLSFEKAFVINVTNVNEAPTDIQLTTNVVPENGNANESLATLATSDQDGDDTFSYSLVSGAGGDDNDRFSIVAGRLFARASFDFESKNNYSIRLRSTDAGGLFVEKALSIAVSDVNEPPIAMNLSNATVAENAGAGALVGTLSATDPDRIDAFSYALVPGLGSDDNAGFKIVGSELRTLANFDYELKNAYSVRIRLTDAAGFTLEKAFAISVIDEVDTVALPGDTNHDGIFNSTDLILAFQVGEYEDKIAGNSVWADGDWNGDGEFDSGDIVFAFQRSVYVLDDVFGAIAAMGD